MRLLFTVVCFIVGTVPLLFAAVQTWVWSVYSTLIAGGFLSILWGTDKTLDFRQVTLSAWAVGIFFLYTLFQLIPLPLDLLVVVHPVQHHLIVASRELIDKPIVWHAISYGWRDSLAWWFFLLSLSLFFIVFNQSVSTRRRLRLVLWIVFGIASLEALYGLLQALLPGLGVLWADNATVGFGNARGTYINRNHFAGFFEMTMPLLLGFASALDGAEKLPWKGRAGASNPRSRQWFLGLGLVIMTLAMLFSRSRAGITGLAVGGIAFVVLMHTGRKGLSRPALVVILSFVSLLIVYALRIGIDPILERFLQVNDDTSRIDMWRDAWAMVTDFPMGIGLGAFCDMFKLYEVSNLSDSVAIHAHNDYLQLLIEAGWVGFIALVGGFFGFLLISFRKVKRLGADVDPFRFYVGIGALSGLVAMAFHSVFDFNLQIPANCIYFVALIAVVHSCFWQLPVKHK